MSIFEAIATLENELARAKAELLFIRDSEAFRCGVSQERHRIEQLILIRMDALSNWTPHQAGMIRRNELANLREAILEAAK
jgi:hypothetical protein